MEISFISGGTNTEWTFAWPYLDLPNIEGRIEMST